MAEKGFGRCYSMYNTPFMLMMIKKNQVKILLFILMLIICIEIPSPQQVISV